MTILYWKEGDDDNDNDNDDYDDDDDTQVRDWFKLKRDEEDIPTSIDEKPAEYQLDQNTFRVKAEPVEAAGYGFDELNRVASEGGVAVMTL